MTRIIKLTGTLATITQQGKGFKATIDELPKALVQFPNANTSIDLNLTAEQAAVLSVGREITLTLEQS